MEEESVWEDINQLSSFIRDIYDNYREWHLEDEEEWYKEYINRIFMFGDWDFGDRKNISVDYSDFFDARGNYIDFLDEKWDFLWEEYGFEDLAEIIYKIVSHFSLEEEFQAMKPEVFFWPEYWYGFSDIVHFPITARCDRFSILFW